MGEIWLDKRGEHNLVTKIYKQDGVRFASMLTLETGQTWPSEEFESWNSSHGIDNKPFYRVLVG